MKGIVKKFYVDKGYGFIRSEGIENDIFFHFSQIITSGFKTIKEGESVEFDLVDHEKGKQAFNVEKM